MIKILINQTNFNQTLMVDAMVQTVIKFHKIKAFDHFITSFSIGVPFVQNDETIVLWGEFS